MPKGTLLQEPALVNISNVNSTRDMAIDIPDSNDLLECIVICIKYIVPDKPVRKKFHVRIGHFLVNRNAQCMAIL